MAEARPLHLIAMLSLLLQGCTEQQHSSAGPSPDDSKTKMLVGTWEFSLPDGEKNLRLELEKGGTWQWWSPSRQPDPNAKIPIQKGKWFVRDGTLYLRIETTRAHDFPAGIALTYDIVSVSSNTAS